MNATVAQGPNPLRYVAALLSGVLFGAGLAVSGMTQPGKVVGFLDLFGDWDPALLGVMGGGVLVNMVLFPFIKRNRRPLFADKFGIPKRKDIDLRLLLGAVLFGVGWALAGFCPGPALTSLVSGALTPLIFVVFMVVGVLLERVLSNRL